MIVVFCIVMGLLSVFVIWLCWVVLVFGICVILLVRLFCKVFVFELSVVRFDVSEFVFW